MISGIDGGIMMPSVPPAATIPTANRWGYPREDISGIATLPIVAAVATELPLIAAKTPQDKSVAIPRPPGRCPTQACMAENRLLPTPPFSKILDIKRNIGIETSTKLSMAPKRFCDTINGETSLSSNMIVATLMRPNATGRPLISTTVVSKMIRITVISMSYRSGL